MKWEKLRKMNQYVLVGRECNEEIKDFWNWLLNATPDVEIMNEDADGNIEFLASKETAKQLFRLHRIDYGYLFDGDLEEFYEMERV